MYCVRCIVKGSLAELSLIATAAAVIIVVFVVATVNLAIQGILIYLIYHYVYLKNTKK